jgi:peptide/nickel transport system substrate-binding protein
MGVSLAAPTTMYPQHLNPQPAAIADAPFRRALIQAIDRQSLVDTLLSGQSQVADSFISPGEAEYQPTLSAVVKYGYDPAAATRGIEEMGFSKGADGVFRALPARSSHWRSAR